MKLKPTYSERMRARAQAANERKLRRELTRIDKWFIRQLTQEEREARADRFKTKLESVRGRIPTGESRSVMAILASFFGCRKS